MKLKPSGWAELPPELLVTIVSGFSWRQLLSLRRVCVRWHGVITDQVMDSLAGGDKRLEYNWLHGAAEVSTRIREKLVLRPIRGEHVASAPPITAHLVSLARLAAATHCSDLLRLAMAWE